ncbi:MAG: DUF1963 domain-containing protein [Candidatus Limnocylindrales bacterium]|jgi:hypothetical protein
MAVLDRFFKRSRARDGAQASVPELAATADVAADWRAGLPPEAAALVRPCYLPETAAGPFGNRSGFGGVPYLPRGVEHPVCQGCWLPMTLFVQLRLDELPNHTEEGPSGLLQLFYCTNEEPDLCERSLNSWAPLSAGGALRIVSAQGGSVSDVPPRYPTQTITGWHEELDLPNWEELRSMGIVLEEQLALRLMNQDLPRVGDKLAGWPAWVRGVDYPSCPVCGATMRLVFQLESADHVPFKFGNSGTGHITQCETHRNLVAFGWVCD